MIKLLEILLLVIPPVAWKLWKDRNGTVHPNREPITVFIIMNVCVLVCAFHLPYNGFYSLMIALLKSFSVSITGYALIFPYAFNWMWHVKWYKMRSPKYKRLPYILNHLSEKAWPDRMPLWVKIGWFGRLLTYIILFVFAIYWFLNP